jgi:hypothetical protein
METQSRLKNCYCFHRSFEEEAAKVEALNRFRQEECLWRDQPRAASAFVANPLDVEYFWVVITIGELTEARAFEAVDMPADTSHDRVSFDAPESAPLAICHDGSPPDLAISMEERTLTRRRFRFGNSETPLAFWIRVN